MEYQLVSVATVLRDYIEVEYKSQLQKDLVDIADSLYNAGLSVADFSSDYQVKYYEQTPEFWANTLADIKAIKSQLTNDRHRDDLIADYAEMIAE
jgi:hypothetical protein